MPPPSGYGTTRLDESFVSSVSNDSTKTWNNYCAIGKDTADHLLDIGAGGEGSAQLVSAHGGTIRFCIAEELVTLSGATTDSTILTSKGCILLGITARVITTITGCTSWNLGYEASGTVFGTSLGLTAGTSVSFRTAALANPTAYDDHAHARFTAVGGGASFTGGTVRVCIHYIDLLAPTS